MAIIQQSNTSQIAILTLPYICAKPIKKLCNYRDALIIIVYTTFSTFNSTDPVT